MIPRSIARQLFVAAAVLITLAACAGSATTFDPTVPCGVDGRAAGAYPDLEAKVPTTFEGRASSSLDSGRHCSEAALGSLIVHGVSEVHYAGATWDLGSGTGISSAIFQLPGGELPATWIAEFYDIGARTAKRTENIATSSPTIERAGVVYRLDTLNNLSLQTVIVWGDGSDVRVVLVATSVDPSASRAAHDDLVARTIAATTAVQTGAATSPVNP
ncbi:MAG: hypothetical protein ABI555_07060 [Chloroflexota bacterium]